MDNKAALDQLKDKLEMISAVIQKHGLNEISVGDIRVWRAEIPKPAPQAPPPPKPKTPEEKAKEDDDILFYSSGGMHG